MNCHNYQTFLLLKGEHLFDVLIGFEEKTEAEVLNSLLFYVFQTVSSEVLECLFLEKLWRNSLNTCIH